MDTLVANPEFECQECGGIEEVPYGEDLPYELLCGSCSALFELELSTLLSRAVGMYR